MARPDSSRRPRRRRAPRPPGRPAGGRPGEAREALLQAARELLETQGLPRVTAREVAERAGLNAGLVRYYFGSKDGLLRAVVHQIAGEASARWGDFGDTGGDPRGRLRGLIASMVENFQADPYAPRLITEQVLFADDEFAQQFADEFGRAHTEALAGILADGRRSGAFRDVPAEQAVPAIAGATILYFLASSLFGRVFGKDMLAAERVERFSAAVADLVLDGIAQPEPRA